MIRWVTAITIAAAFAVGGVARAYCVAPTPPSEFEKPDKPEPPIKPLCAATNSCDEFEVQRYNDEVDEYNAQLSEYNSEVDDYVQKLKAYVSDAVDYAKCKVRELDD